ncbi:hypothetical protein NC652_033567 [Populus alba x Populus x berolinensis]|nr:hypothetical protein NC652_033549 [Populus alba x Populus x berolinensis]KAJ6880262.1 hypothetical protein NC652_033567 [Populus alba x Populus x berolinensis]
MFGTPIFPSHHQAVSRGHITLCGIWHLCFPQALLMEILTKIPKRFTQHIVGIRAKDPILSQRSHMDPFQINRT